MPLENNPANLGLGGLGVATVGENPYAPYFGDIYLPDARFRPLDPTQRRPSTIRNLPDAYVGNNERLLSRIEEQLIFNSDFLAKEVLPMRETDKMEFYWNVWKFHNTLLRPVPYQGTSRYLSNETSQDKKSTIRYGIAFILEHEFMKTEQGRLNYEYNLRSIAHAVSETHNFDILRALIGANKDIEWWTKNMSYYKSKTLQDIMEEERSNFALLQKTKNGFDKMAAMATERITLYGGKATLWLIEPILKFYLGLVPPEKTDYYLAGPAGPSRVQNGGGQYDDANPLYVLGGGTSAYLVRQFNYDNHQNLCAMQRQRSIGEYYTLFPLSGTNPRSYSKHEREIVIENQDKDCWHLLTLETAIMNCCMFQTRPGPNGLHLLDDTLFSKTTQDGFKDDPYNPFLMDATNSSATTSIAKSAVKMRPVQVYGHLSERMYNADIFLQVSESIVNYLGAEAEKELETILSEMHGVMNKVWTTKQEFRDWIFYICRPNANAETDAVLKKIGPSQSRYNKCLPYNRLTHPNSTLTTVQEVTAAAGNLQDGPLVFDSLRKRIGTSNYAYWANHPSMISKISPAIRKLNNLLPNCSLLDEKLTPSDYERNDMLATFFEYALGLSQFRFYINPVGAQAISRINDGGAGPNIATIKTNFQKTLVSELRNKWVPLAKGFNSLEAGLGNLLGYFLGGLIYDFAPGDEAGFRTLTGAEADIYFSENADPTIASYDHVLTRIRGGSVPFINVGLDSKYINYQISLFIATILAIILQKNTLSSAEKVATVKKLFGELYTGPLPNANYTTTPTNVEAYAEGAPRAGEPETVIRLTGVPTGAPNLKTDDVMENLEKVLTWIEKNQATMDISNNIKMYLASKRNMFKKDFETTQKYERAGINSMLFRFIKLSDEDLRRIGIRVNGAGNRNDKLTIVSDEVLAPMSGKINYIGDPIDLPNSYAPDNVDRNTLVRTSLTLSSKQFIRMFELMYKERDMVNPFVAIGSLENKDTPATLDEMTFIYKTLTAMPGSREYAEGIDRFPQLVSYIDDPSRRASYLSILGLYYESNRTEDTNISRKRSKLQFGASSAGDDLGMPDGGRKPSSHAVRGVLSDNFGAGSAFNGPEYLPIKNERLVNHWHNIHQAGSSSTFIQSVARCLLMTPFSRESLLNLYRNNCITPVSCITARPHMIYFMSLAIYLLPGSRTGNLMIGKRDFQLANDAKTKTFYGHFTLHSVPVVTAPENVRVIYDVFSKEYLGGGGVHFWNSDLLNRYDPSTGKTMDADMFSFLVAYTENEQGTLRNPIDVSGHMSYLDAPGLIQSQSELIPHYSTAGFYNKYWRFRTIEMFHGHTTSTINFFHPFHSSPIFQQFQYNTVCWQGGQGTWNHLSKKHDNLQLNTGHWGETGFGPGSKRVKNGALETFKSVEDIIRSINI